MNTQVTGADFSAPLNPHFTFDTFVVGSPNEFASAAAKHLCAADDAGFDPLFVYGATGLGKTHLLQAIVWHLKGKDPTANIIYLSGEQFMYRYVEAMRSQQTDAFREAVRSADVLVIDDIQALAGKESTQEEFFHTLNFLLQEEKHVIVSADQAPGDINGLDGRLKSRLQWGLVADLGPTDYTLRIAILEKLVAAMCEKHDGITFNHEVVEFLAHRLTVNVRVLEGSVNRLTAYALLVGQEITLETTQQSLHDLLQEANRKLTIDRIMRKVCDFYGISVTDLLSPKRSYDIARPRQVVMYLAKNLTQRSYPEIGKRLGGRDHTTIIHGVRKIEELLHHDSTIYDDVELLKCRLTC